MAEERIDSLFDVPAILKERDTVLAAMKSITDEMAKSTVDASKQKSVLTDAKTAKEAAAAITQVDAETKKLSNSTKKLSDEQNALNRLNKTLVRTQVQQSEAGQKVVNALDRERAELKAISFERQKAIQQERSQADYTRAFAKELDLASMNISEMQRELSRLNAMSFKGLDPAQIATVKARMAELTDGIGDFQTRVKIASTDAIPSVTNALSGLVGIAQGVTGTLAIFGVENKKLEQTMVGLISVSMALKAAQEMHEGRTLKVAAATIKDAFAKAAATISTKAYAMATGGATTATRLLGKAMMTIPFIAIAAAIVGLVIAVGKMANAYKEAGSMAKLMEDVQTKQHEIAADEIVQLGTLERRLIATKDNKKEYAKVVKEYNETIGNKYNASLKETANSFDEITRAAFTARVAIMENAAAQAAADKMKELVSKNFDEYLVYMDAQVKVQELRVKKMQQLEDNAKMRFESTEEMEAFFRNQINYDKLINETYEAAGVSSKLAYEFDRLMAIGTMYSKQTKVVTKATKDSTDKDKDKLEKLKAIRKSYQDYIVLLDDIKRGVVSDTDAFSQLSKMHADGTITAREFAEANKLILKSITSNDFPDKIKYTTSYIDQLSQSFSGLNKLLEEEQITPEEWAERWKALMEKTAKDTEDKAAKMKESLLSITDEAMKGFGAFVDYQNTKGDAQIQIYERQQADQQDILEQRLAAGYITQAQYDAQTAALEESYNAKKIEIERQQAQRSKALAVFEVGVNTAKAIMEIWGAYAANIPLALAFSALAATTGAFQLAAINAQPLPGYAHGRDGGDAEFAYTGEQGTEAIVTNGNVFFTPPTSTLTYLPAGASVIPAPQTASMIESGLFTNSTESLSLQKLDDIEKAIRNKREFHVNITDKGVGMSAKQAANYINYINRNARI